MSDSGPEGDGERRARTFSLGATKASVAMAVLGIAASGVLFEAPQRGALIVLLVVAVCLGGAALRRSRAIVVGVDGVRIEGWRGTRFVGYADLLDVKMRSRREGVTLHTKRAVRIAIGTTFAGPRAEVEIAEAIRDALERWREASIARERAQREGVTLHTKRAVRIAIGTTFAGPRAEVEIAEAIRDALERWRATSIARERAARDLPPALPITALATEGAAHYRVASVPTERLMDLIEDPAATIAVRVAAASALRIDPDDACAADRLARVADATASVELRRALDSRGRA